MYKKIFLLFILFSLFLFSFDFQEIEKRVTEFTLSNGLKVIIYENHLAPVFSALTYANVGSVNEHVGITGLAHIFEHMAFKGTSVIGTKDWEKESKAIEKEEKAFLALKEEKAKGSLADPEKLKKLEEEFEKAKEEAKLYVKPNEFSEIVEREGCTGLNASTSFDQTQYYYNFPSNKLELWAYIESERFIDPVLREFYTEKNGVIAEERRMGIESQPIGRLFEEFLGLCFRAHPYSAFVVGHMSDILNITRDDAMKFYQTYYIANNLIIVLVGDIYPDNAKPFLEKYFGRLPSKPLPPPVATQEPKQLGERRIVIKDPSQPFILLGFHKGDFNDPDEAVFEAITDILGTGRTSRLYKRLVRDEKLALDAGAFTGLPGKKYPGLFIFYAMPMQGKSNEENEKAILEEIEKLKNEPVTDEELKRLKVRAKGNFIRGLESNMGIAVQLATYEAITGSWKNLLEEIDKIEKVKKEDIMRVAKKYFTEENRTVAILEHNQGGDK